MCIRDRYKLSFCTNSHDILICTVYTYFFIDLFYLAQQVKLDNFYDEAYIMIRMNEGTPGNIEGGELTHITGNLYLLSLIHI